MLTVSGLSTTYVRFKVEVRPNPSTARKRTRFVPKARLDNCTCHVAKPSEVDTGCHGPAPKLYSTVTTPEGSAAVPCRSRSVAYKLVPSGEVITNAGPVVSRVKDTWSKYALSLPEAILPSFT